MTDQNADCSIAVTGGDAVNGSRSDACRRSRREFLTTLAAFGLTSVAPVGELIAQTAAPRAKPSLLCRALIPPTFVLAFVASLVETSDISVSWVVSAVAHIFPLNFSCHRL